MRVIKIVSFLLVCILAISPITVLGLADSDIMIDLTVNGTYIKTDMRPYLVKGTTYVPVRAISEALNADEVIWDGGTKTVTIKDQDTQIVMKIGENAGYVNGRKVAISGGVALVGDRTFVPVRFVAESFDAEVSWDGKYYVVGINKDGVTVPQELAGSRGYSDDDLYWLSRIIEAESAGESQIGKIAVGNVILNRVKSPDYPNTIYDVIFDRKYGVQFQPVINGMIYNNPSASCIAAAKQALSGVDEVGDSLFFLNPSISTNFWIMQNRQYFSTIGNHLFYL